MNTYANHFHTHDILILPLLTRATPANIKPVT